MVPRTREENCMKIPEVGEFFKTRQSRQWLIEGDRRPYHLPKDTIMLCAAIKQSPVDTDGTLFEFRFLTPVGFMVWTVVDMPQSIHFAYSIEKLLSDLERMT